MKKQIIGRISTQSKKWNFNIKKMKRNAIYEFIIGTARSSDVNNTTIAYRQLIKIVHAVFGPDYYKPGKGQGIAKVVREACKYATYFFGKQTADIVKKTYHR